MVHLLWKIAWQFFKKLKMELPYNLAIPLLGISKKIQSRILKRYLYTHVHHIIDNSQEV